MDISFRQDQALYLQIADHFRRQIAIGKLRPGERLPAIRELAQKLGIDPGTVARAYKELHREGIITGYRGGGSMVSPTATDRYLSEQQRRRLNSLIDTAVLGALGLGFTTEEVETAFTLNLAQWRERRIPAAPLKPDKQADQANEVRFFGSHDIAVELLAHHLTTLYPEIRLSTSFVGSLAGLMALENGEGDITGAHLMDNESGEYNIPFIKRLMPNESVVLINLVQRVQGLMVAPGNPKHIRGISDLKSPDITFVNRQKGSGTRMLLDSQLLRLGIPATQVRGYQREEKTHVAVANAVAQGEADTGLGAESAAIAAGLGFIRLVKERYDLVMLRETLNRPQVKKVVEMVGDESYQKMLSSLSGYDLSDTGKMVTVHPK